MRTGLRRDALRLPAGPTIAGILVFGIVILGLSRMGGNSIDANSVGASEVPAHEVATTADGETHATRTADSSPPHRATARDAGSPTHVIMRNVDFHVDSSIVLRIRHLRGTMRGHEGRPIVFDDKRSFSFRLAWGEVAVTSAHLSALLNRYVFDVKGAPLRRLSIRTAGSELVQSGQMKKGLWIPFRIRTTVHATPDGRIRLHPTRVSVAGIPAGGVLRWLGVQLEDLLSMERVSGVTVDGNDLLLNPTLVLPPPGIEGRVTDVRVEDGELVQVFGSERAADSLGPLRVPLSRNGNYMFYRGGTLRFGKLIMTDADLQILDLDPKDPFRFFLDRYAEQLVAGYSRTLPDLGLAAFMKDVDDLASSSPRLGEARGAARN
jgi:hypothetical protein